MGLPPAGALGSSIGKFVTVVSVVNNKEATLPAEIRAVLTTLVGSIIPNSNIFPTTPFWALIPIFSFPSFSKVSAINSPEIPELLQIDLMGYFKDSLTILIPWFWSWFSPVKFLIWLIAYNKAHPPPITIPSSEAALVAQIASSILSFNSLTSVSLAPPTLRIATPPVNLASLSWNFSLSYCEVDKLIEFLISSTLSFNAWLGKIKYFKI
jgi:hypothetical protein